MENIKYIILGLIISIVAIYYYRKYVVIEDSVEKFRNGRRYNSYAVPNNWKRDTAYITITTGQLLYMYRKRKSTTGGMERMNWWGSGSDDWNGQWIGWSYIYYPSRRIVHHEVAFKPGDSIYFFTYTWSQVNFVAGHIFWNGKYYPTNKDNFELKGIQGYTRGKGWEFVKSSYSEGCYRDGGSRRLPYYYSTVSRHADCRWGARMRGHSLYGLQNGNQCWTGNSLSRAKAYGKLPNSKCNKSGGYGAIQKLGGPWANEIYHSNKLAKIKYYNRMDGRWLRGPSNRRLNTPYNGWMLFYPQTYGLVPDLNTSNTLHRWVQWAWEPREPPAKQKYCPDPTYTEFNPAACMLNDSADSCYRSPLKNYTPDWNKCHNKLNVSHNDYDNNDFFQIIHEAFELTKNKADLSKQSGDAEHRNNKYYTLKYRQKLITNLREDVNICCMILGNTDEYLDVNQCNAEYGTLDIGKYTGILKRALKEIQPSKMKNGKNANQFLANNLRESLKRTVNFARIVRGKGNSAVNDCRCLKFAAGGIKCTPC